MGSFERFITLTVVFLAAIMLVVNFSKVDQQRGANPSEDLARYEQRGLPSSGADRLAQSDASSSSPLAGGLDSRRSPAAPGFSDLEAGPKGGGKQGAAAAGGDSLAPLGATDAGDLSAQSASGNSAAIENNADLRAGLLSAAASRGGVAPRLWNAPESNRAGAPLILRDVPGLQPYPVTGAEMAQYKVSEGESYASIAEKLYGDAGLAEALSLTNDARGEAPRAGDWLLVPIYRESDALEADNRPVQSRPRAGARPQPASVVGERPTAGAVPPGAVPAVAVPAVAVPAVAAPAVAVPAVAVPAVTRDQGGEPSAVRTYVVGPGDTLSRISVRFYGKESEWRTIWQANLDQLPNPDRLIPTMVLKIP